MRGECCRIRTCTSGRAALASAFVRVGSGTNMIYVDPEHDLVAVARWIEGRAMDEFVKRLLAAVEGK
jgi:hypothetical protein